MTLVFLYLRDFRNYQNLELQLEPGVSLFYGNNAQGKTNLLEACYYLSTLSSLRAEREADLARWGSSKFQVGGRLEGVGPKYIKIETTVYPALRRQIQMDDQPANRADLISAFPCVYFSPDDLYIVKKGSSLRRRYLDMLFSKVIPGYQKDLSRYEDIVVRRNKTLKKVAYDSYWKRTLDELDEMFLRAGTTVLAHRMSLLNSLVDHISKTYRFISLEDCGVNYESSVGDLPADKEQISSVFEKKMEECRKEEGRRGITMIGPHRDDLCVSLEGKPVRYFGSQGQQRSVALALRMAEAKVLEDKFSVKPALFLDDVFSELDESRRSKVISLHDFGHQILLTSTDPIWLTSGSFKTYSVAHDTVARK